MRKIIIMGECALDINFSSGVPEASFPAGRLLNAAAILGQRGRAVTFVGECARDRVGDIIVDFLASKGVVTTSIDRYTEGVTPLNLYFEPDATHAEPSHVLYRRFPDEKFDVVWPRIDSGDIVVFGTAFAFDSRVRPQLQELINYARTRGALIIYIPGFLSTLAPRITRVMPAILENLEVADLVMTRTPDLDTIFGDNDPARVYKRNISFYSQSFINIDHNAGQICYYSGDNIATRPIPAEASRLDWQADSLASLIEAIIDLDIDRRALASPAADMMERVVARAVPAPSE